MSNKANLLVFVICMCLLFFSSVHATAKEGAAMHIISTAFENNEIIPKKYTCDGQNVSPPLNWAGVPAGAKSITIICDDPDAPMGTWIHWVIYGISPDAASLPENVPPQKEVLRGAKQGINDFKKIGYGGPCPPKGPAHRYFFKIYALDIELNLPAGASKKDVEKAMQGHILAEGQLVGKYGR
ncbi:MAG: YbhB/YbcL family Raf kinase inhibitor-like protein [Deltaproteobacteria bacterium]|nr:YbhB/YbcL family Raf kinase inhibitor-like protein [Deltaproteobacteria bacterium]